MDGGVKKEAIWRGKEADIGEYVGWMKRKVLGEGREYLVSTWKVEK